MTYETSWRGLTFHDVVPPGALTARQYLEACLERIETREPVVRAFAALNIEGARIAADGACVVYQGDGALKTADTTARGAVLEPQRRCLGVFSTSARVRTELAN